MNFHPFDARLASQQAGCLGLDVPDAGMVRPGHGLRLGYYAQEHETLDVSRTVLENMRSAAPALADPELRRVLGSFLFPGHDVNKPAGVLSGGEKTRLALAGLVASTTRTVGWGASLAVLPLSYLVYLFYRICTDRILAMRMAATE